MKAIETNYNGYRFRSRTEARWAIFFDCYSLPYCYEDEGYIVGDQPYLPDFYIPNWNCFVEIKGEATADERALCARLRDESCKPVLLIEGSPGHETVTLYCWDINDSSGGSSSWKVAFTLEEIRLADPNDPDRDGERIFELAVTPVEFLSLLRNKTLTNNMFEPLNFLADDFGGDPDEGYARARRARFEHSRSNEGGNINNVSL